MGGTTLPPAGIYRQAIFCDKRDRDHFLELLEEMSVRFDVRVHAYVLMGNHYNLLIMTPQANASRAVQWLNVSTGDRRDNGFCGGGGPLKKW